MRKDDKFTFYRYRRLFGIIDLDVYPQIPIISDLTIEQQPMWRLMHDTMALIESIDPTKLPSAMFRPEEWVDETGKIDYT